ncbi:MAG: type II secretion system F family protein [Euryarchaeota archaeon]|nr:type II secretion system F family protein [Euryarchaeota archaeon]
MAGTARSNDRLRVALLKANIKLRPEVYLSFAYLNMTLTFVLGLVAIGLLVAFRALDLINVSTTGLLLLAPLPFVLAATIYLLAFALPDLRANTRARDIEVKLPYALNFVATMASAGTTIDKTLAALAAEPIYGEVAIEAGLITRDLRLLGRDVVGALTAAIDRTPSVKFQDFLQGAVITATSGGDLKNYFRTKADQYAVDNRQEQKQFLEQLGLISESFVVTVVAAPLFLLVMLSVMTSFGETGASLLSVGYIVILLVLPLAQGAFALIIKTVAREP